MWFVVSGLVVFSTGCTTPPKKFEIKEFAPGIFLGCKPHSQEQFDLLHQRGVRTVLSLETLPWDIRPERKLARDNGIMYRNVPILASPLAPREKRVRQALLVLSDPSLRPIFLHCYLSEDRTSLVLGLYRIYFEDWTPAAAWHEMLDYHFHVRLTLRGFETYFWSHTEKPNWVFQARTARQQDNKTTRPQDHKTTDTVH
ncbi:MAG: hypothetical protein C5B50_28740 [Verrucomicrobia bacterium]|nr:MAG: hypothetical protein C5B50_28740 [Verrucomicrobiota bacterium]